jgi:RNA polymerase sigma-70 factor (ECF subfamily)
MTTRMSSAMMIADESQPDVDVIDQVLGGQTALFELLMRRYNERIYRTARSIVRNDLEAEDVPGRDLPAVVAHYDSCSAST